MTTKEQLNKEFWDCIEDLKIICDQLEDAIQKSNATTKLIDINNQLRRERRV